MEPGCACYAERDGEMHVLDLGNNSISREGASALAAYMKKSVGLKELNMYMNDIGTAGITDVRHGFRAQLLCRVHFP